MNISDKGLALIKEFEGCELHAYRCPANVLTIGYGHTGPDVASGMVIDQAKATELLRKDLGRFERGVMAAIQHETTQGRFDALVSLAFNIGLGNLQSSTLLRKHCAADYAGAADQFARWNKGGGKVLPGLTRRRAAEATLYRGLA